MNMEQQTDPLCQLVDLFGAVFFVAWYSDIFGIFVFGALLGEQI